MRLSVFLSPDASSGRGVQNLFVKGKKAICFLLFRRMWPIRREIRGASLVVSSRIEFLRKATDCLFSLRKLLKAASSLANKNRPDERLWLMNRLKRIKQVIRRPTMKFNVLLGLESRASCLGILCYKFGRPKLGQTVANFGTTGSPVLVSGDSSAVLAN